MAAVDVKLSKSLSWLLRHGAAQVGCAMDSEGFCAVAAILALPQFRAFSAADVERVIATNGKQRFALRHDVCRGTLVRANQGHTLAVDKLELQPITDGDAFATVVHGSTWHKWASIRARGLSRMSRQHIHLAPGMPGDGQVVSGMRQSCDLWIFVDLKLALADGFVFSLSANNVILTAGDSDGFLPVKYFSRVLRKVGNNLVDVDHFYHDHPL